MSPLVRRLLLAALFLSAAAAGCKKAAPPRTVANQASLVLSLPDSPGRPGRLEVDGQEVALPEGEGPLLVTPAEGATEMKLVYTFWPDAHTSIVRKKTIAPRTDGPVKVDLLKEDDRVPDRYYPEYVPTPPEVLQAMGRLAKVAKGDVVYDVGAGDGAVALAAVTKLGARAAVALEYDEDQAKKARVKVEAAGAGKTVRVVEENVLERTDFTEANVLILSWTTPVNQRLVALLRKTLRHGTRIVSCRSTLGDWKPDATQSVSVRDGAGAEVVYKVHLWTVRAKVEPNLYLDMPESEAPPEYAPERVSKLEIDGKDFSEPRVSHRALLIEPKAGADSVRVEYTFWPNTYTQITRAVVVKLAKGKETRASLLKPTPGVPDKIRPIYVPTPEEVVDAMCKLAKVGKDDVVYDIGCGDGRLVIRSAKKFAAKKGVGIDINPSLVKLCQENAKKEGVEKRVTFEAKDAQKIDDFSEATVVFLYLGDFLNEALRPTLQKTLKPGTRVVSHRFLMGDWKPDRTEVIRAKDNNGEDEEFKLHLWTIK